MDYDAARGSIKTGDMLLWRNHQGGGLRAVIERWFVVHGTGDPHVHVGLAWSEHGRVWAMDMTTKGCAPRLLSSCGDFDWARAPRELSEEALRLAFDGFGELQYSRWQAFLGGIKRLIIGADKLSQCAEYALAIWLVDGMAPTDTATPGACADGAMGNWGTALEPVRGPRLKSTPNASSPSLPP